MTAIQEITVEDELWQEGYNACQEAFDLGEPVWMEGSKPTHPIKLQGWNMALKVVNRRVCEALDYNGVDRRTWENSDEQRYHTVKAFNRQRAEKGTGH